MKFIFLALLGILIIQVDLALFEEVKDNVLNYLISSALALNQIPEKYQNSNESNSKYILNSQNPLTIKARFDDYDTKEAIEWGKNYVFDIDNDTKQVQNKNYRTETGDDDKPIFLSSYKKGDAVDQVIPSVEHTKNGFTVAAKNYYHLDPVLNSLRRQPRNIAVSVDRLPTYKHHRKNIVYRRDDDTKVGSSAPKTSSSRELGNFKDQYRNVWMHKKYEAMNHTKIHGDNVKILAARPWGVACGDPNQHDMPWGSCMLSIECEPDLRIYRGDLFCGRTQYICCALQLSSYDTYQGFDVSFDDKDLSTDSEEKKASLLENLKNKKEGKSAIQKKRKAAREARKKKLRKKIQKIVKEIRKILNKQYKNGTRQRKKKTQELKNFIKELKTQYKKDRQSVKDLHTHDLIVIDASLMDRLTLLQQTNNNFLANATFREALLKGTMSRSVARSMLDSYPELDEFLEARLNAGGDTKRNFNVALSNREDSKTINSRLPAEGDVRLNPNARRTGGADYINYDVEYGYLYY